VLAKAGSVAEVRRWSFGDYAVGLNTRIIAMTVFSQEKWRPVELYGGAITAQFPERFVDVSDFRPVPDHQEVSDGQTVC
jgi:hypothetical protein